MSRARLGTSTVLLALGVALAGGAVCGAMFAPQATGSDEREAATPTDAPVDVEQFDDQRDLAVTPVVSPGADLVVEATGRLTSTTCAPGAVFTSGQTPLAVDGRAVIALRTAMPLWRSLSVGDEGADVEALTGELASLGYEVEPGDYYSWTVAAAINELGDDNGVDLDGRLSPADVLWLPDESVHVADCALTMGQQATVGAAFATTQKRLDAVRLDGPSAEQADGEHVFRLGDVEAAVPASGEVDDAALVKALAASDDYQRWLASGGETALSLTYVLPEAQEVAVVPPSALFALTQSSACIRSVDGTNYAVDVVSSQLGQTMVRFGDDADVPERVTLNPNAESTC